LDDINYHLRAAVIKRYTTTERPIACLLSGGLDSVFSLHLATKAGLDVLAVHMDNGWNSNLAQINIENIVTKTSTKLITNVISWTEYRDLQKAFFAADVVDIEMLYDQAVYGTLFKVARENNMRTIIAGTNQATEGFAMPSNFAYSNKLDSTNVLDIWARYGSRRSILT
jgi:tRNA(Ile)-lysidine synthase TilS/MesJ